MSRSPLDADHRRLGARMAPFAGWEMPLWYVGVLEEHRRCRQEAVVFDVSHLGSIAVEGPAAAATVQNLFTNDLRRIGPGRAQYTLLLDDEASVVDDLVVWWLTEERLVVVPNAANTAMVGGILEEAAGTAGGGVEVRDVTASRALLAAQGRRARTLLTQVAPELPRVERFEAAPTSFGALAGTGYTGEPGVELFVEAGEAHRWWGRLVDGGFTPAGLGARDTLRLEMGYPLHGSDLGPGITPLQAGLGWTIGWDKKAFVGRDALLAERRRGVTRRLRGVLLGGRQVPRHGCRVLAGGVVVGEVTSGNLSPTLERGVALALLSPNLPQGSPVEIDIRGRPTPGRIVGLPFVRGPEATGDETAPSGPEARGPDTSA